MTEKTNSLTLLTFGYIAALAVLVPQSRAAGSRPWTPLFNGRSLEGWEHVGRGSFVVEGGMLKTNGGMGLLWYTKERVGNTTVPVVYRNPGGVNSGVFIRIPEKPTEPWMPVYRGYEVQIDDESDADEYHCTGVLESLTRAMARPARPAEWNTMDITLDRERTVVTINGVLVTDYREGQPVPPKKEHWEPDRGPRPVSGYLGLQNYGPESVVYFREVSLRPLQRP